MTRNVRTMLIMGLKDTILLCWDKNLIRSMSLYRNSAGAIFQLSGSFIIKILTNIALSKYKEAKSRILNQPLTSCKYYQKSESTKPMKDGYH